MVSEKKAKTTRDRTLQLETVRFALERGYKALPGNATARKHFRFIYPGIGSPDIEVSWYTDRRPSVTVGDTSTIDTDALRILKRFW